MMVSEIVAWFISTSCFVEEWPRQISVDSCNGVAGQTSSQPGTTGITGKTPQGAPYQ